MALVSPERMMITRFKLRLLIELLDVGRSLHPIIFYVIYKNKVKNTRLFLRFVLYYNILKWSRYMFEVKMLEKSHPYGANTYIVSSLGEYLVIDPSTPPEKDAPKPKYILLTHSHFDHILFLEEWASLGGEVLICSEELSGPSDPDFNCFDLFFGQKRGYFGAIRGLSDKESITIGDETVTLMHTPGHTKGSSVYLIGDLAFVGDTVFAGGGYGRWDLPSGSYSDLRASIEKVKTLSDDTLLYPGHGEPTTVKEFKKDYTI